MKATFGALNRQGVFGVRTAWIILVHSAAICWMSGPCRGIFRSTVAATRTCLARCGAAASKAGTPDPAGNRRMEPDR